MSTNCWWVYLLLCNDGSFYTGSTTDVTRRIAQHNNGVGAKYTRGRRPCQLGESFGPFPNRSIAQKVEARIKKLSRDKKMHLTESDVDTMVMRIHRKIRRK